jgi:hypothetical protein
MKTNAKCITSSKRRIATIWFISQMSGTSMSSSIKIHNKNERK